MASVGEMRETLRPDDEVVGEVEVETGPDRDVVERLAAVSEQPAVDLAAQREQLGRAHDALETPVEHVGRVIDVEQEADVRARRAKGPDW